jgi:hypothetical protein
MTATRPSTTDVLMHMIVAFLAPMFLATTGGDIDQARNNATETVRACITRNPIDLFLIGQMIALGLATLSSVSLSMAEDMPISLILRLRGNAVSLHHASEKCRRALPEPGSAPARQQAPLSDEDLEREKELLAETSRTRQRVNAYQASYAQPRTPPAPNPRVQAASPQDGPNTLEAMEAMKAAMADLVAESERHLGETKATGPAIPKTALHSISTGSDRILRATWSELMPDATPEQIEDLLNMMPAEYRSETMRTQALGTTANHLISGAAPPR